MKRQQVLQSVITAIWMILSLVGCDVTTPDLVSEAPVVTPTPKATDSPTLIIEPTETNTPELTATPVPTARPIPTIPTPTSTVSVRVDNADGNEVEQCSSSFTLLPDDHSLPPQSLATFLINLNLPTGTLPLDILKHQLIEETEEGEPLALYWTLDNGCTFWLVYVLLDEPPYPLFLLKFDKASREWFNPLVINDYVGQLQGIRRVKNFYLIDTHINPSAGTTIIVPHDMKTYHILEGFVQAVYDDDIIIYTPNEIHFAPTHPSKIGIYNPFTQDTKIILPQNPVPPLWAEYANKMRGIYEQLIADGWCARNNHHCKSEWFTRYFRKVTANSITDSLAFFAYFEGKGPSYGGPYELSNGQVLSIENQVVVYIYRGIHSTNQLEYREFDIKELEQTRGEDFELAELLEKETLDQLFKEK